MVLFKIPGNIPF